MQNASKKEILAWSMYDFANSAFATTIIAVVFQKYLVESVVPSTGARLGPVTWDGPTAWSMAYGTSMVVAALMAPIIGAVCDYSAAKKKFLVTFWLLGCVATMSLGLVVPGGWLLGLLLFILGNVAFESSVSLNSAFLPELAPPERLDKISSIGWGIGYIGGGLCLFANLLMILMPSWVGHPSPTPEDISKAPLEQVDRLAASLPSREATEGLAAIGLGAVPRLQTLAAAAPDPVLLRTAIAQIEKPRQMLLATRWALASVGLWWFAFGLFTVLGVRERAVPRPAPGGRSMILAGFVKVFSTIENLKRFRTLAVLTLSVLLSSAGVTVVLAMATSFAATQLKFQSGELILCFLMIQGVAGVGALLTALLADRVPAKTSLSVMLCVWLGCLVWAFFMQTKGEFWGLGAVIGFVMGGTQSLSRGLQAQLTPPSSSAEFFGFYGVTQKLSAAVASYIFAFATGNWGIRAGIASIMILFILGLCLLAPVKIAKGREESAAEEARLQAARAQ